MLTGLLQVFVQVLCLQQTARDEVSGFQGFRYAGMSIGTSMPSQFLS